MSNDKKTQQNEDYRFLDYRLNQYELKLDKALEKIEEQQRKDYSEIMKMLQLMQDGQNQQNRTIIELSTRQKAMEQKVECIDKLREVATKNTTEIRDIERRIEIYKQLLFVIGTGVAVALVTELVKFI